MKIIWFDALNFVLFTTSAILYAVQDEWVLTAMWSFGALLWVATGITNYKTMKMLGY